MAVTIFDFDDSAYRAFSEFYNKAPTRARRATARMLTQFAAGTRLEAIDQINRSMTVRNKRFIGSKMRFRAAKLTKIENQKAFTFSVSGRNFTGWSEQTTGGRMSTTRTQSLMARGGNFDRKVKPSVRMKPGRDFISEDDYNLPPEPIKMKAYFVKVRTKNPRKPFIVKKKYKAVKKGLYIFKRGRMILLQNFEPGPRSVKRNPWMKRARAKYFDKADINAEWGRAIDHILTKRKFR